MNSTVVPAAGDPDVLLLGDFNSYAMEPPVTTITGGGYTDLATSLLGAGTYSYLFDGQLGHLDYAFASSSLTSQVAGVGIWHINADESDLFDYNDEVRDSPGEAAFEEKPDGSALVPPRVVYQPGTAYRASDHDPVMVGLFSTATVPVVVLNPSNPPEPQGAIATYLASATSVPTPSVQWQRSSDGSIFTNIPGETNTTLTINTSVTPNIYQYRAVFTTSAGSATTTATRPPRRR